MRFGNSVIWILVVASLWAVAGCGEDTLKDDAQNDAHAHNSDNGTDNTNPAAPLDSTILVIDATRRDAYAYFSFKANAVVPVADSKNSLDWDVAFKRTEVTLNGGISGPGKAGAVFVENAVLADVREAPANGYAQDSAQDLAIIPESDLGWYHYTGEPNHWILPLKRVFVIRTADGNYAKLQFLGYYKDNDAKKEPGFVTVEYVYQPNGSRSF